MEWSGLEPRQCLELLSWKVDVEWCGLMFQPSTSTPPLDSGDITWEALATSLGLVTKLPANSSHSSTSHGSSVKVAGVVLLLGLGSYLCYKLYRVWLYHQLHHGTATHSRRDDNPALPPTSFADGTPAFSYHHLSSSSNAINDFLNVKTCYFGPLNLNDENDSEHEMSHTQPLQHESGGENNNQNRLRERRRRFKQSSPPSCRGWLLNRLQGLAPAPASGSQVMNGEERLFSKRSPGNSSGTSSTGSSPISHPNHHSLSRDLSFDSLGLFGRSHREGSIDSMSSELSFDMPSFTEQSSENVTVARLDKLQEEIDKLKSNCQMMDEEFETVKCNRNLPGLSDLIETAEHHDGELTVEDVIRQQSAKACFKGLYSLTTINRSMSMDLSLDEDSPQTSNNFGLTQLAEEETYPSLEWDEEYSQDRPNNWSSDTDNANTTVIRTHSPASPNSSSMVDTSGYGSKLDLTCSLTGSQFSCLESPSSPVEELRDSQLLRSMSCESQAEMWSLSDSSSSELDSPTVDNCAFPQRQVNIGPRVDIMTYASQEWTGNTPTANTILRGYKEIVNSLQYRYLRRIRGDNYCALRSAVFQTLAQGIPVPNGSRTMARLGQSFTNASPWCQQWRFNGLPYSGNNVLRGMEICLQSLDNISVLLRSSERSVDEREDTLHNLLNTNPSLDRHIMEALLRSSERSVDEREDTLHNLLNTDPSLDRHVMEAVKLHMMAQALELHEDSVKGNPVPLFSILMYARDTSETPVDFMNNHLLKVGDSGGLEQVEMFLLGYTLGVTLKVVRPSAHGTQQFVCYYPDDNVGAWPEVALLAEDDRHYNILCM